MKFSYNHRQVEAAVQEQWRAQGLFKAADDSPKPKWYVLDMFSYPSGEGLHMGHPMSYIATDILSRYYRAAGYKVLHPQGFDSFGLPAENYAIKVGVHPRQTTEQNIARFTQQIDALGLSYDWSRQVVTSDPGYYRWTQWLFLKLYQQGLAYRATAPVNWCPRDQTVLANEQVVNGRCERCDTPVEQRELAQWFFKITQYAGELLKNLDELDWPEPVKAAQRHWIGRSQGHEVDFAVEGSKEKITVFTTRLDTIFGATYLVLAPEHPLVAAITTPDHTDEVQRYVGATRQKTELMRQEDRDKTGIFAGAYALNPATQEKIPVWIADYVLAGYGTGAIMAVPTHDERDLAFAQRFALPGGSGQLVEVAAAAKKVKARPITRYRLRDWLISRQRYWGAPIPIINCEHCGAVPVPEDQLPVVLPDDVDFKPTGESPLVKSKSFHEGVTCPKCGQPARRETDTMDTFVCSSWYYLRYCDPHNEREAFSAEAVRRWMPVDVYVGGAEHASGHLMFARFITKVLADTPSVQLPFREPFSCYRSQGFILGENGEKMSKSRGNVVNPDEIIERYGADALRLFEMFMGPFEAAKPWSANGIIGVRRFIERIAAFFHEQQEHPNWVGDARSRSIHATVKKVTTDIKGFNFNTAVSALMIFFNGDDWRHDRVAAESFLQLLHPFAPHLAEYCWQLLGRAESIQLAPWPTFDTALATAGATVIAVQVNGKLRATLTLESEVGEKQLKELALALPAVQRSLAGKRIKRTVVVPGKVVSIVVA